MTIRELCELLHVELPEGVIGDFVIFINGQPAFTDAKVDVRAKIVYLNG